MDTFNLTVLLLLGMSASLYAQQTCNGGFYVGTNDAGNEVCLSCPQDTYKLSIDSVTATECTACPEESPRNHQTGSSDAADCIYAACGQGQQYNQSDFLQCLDCDIGTYQDKTYPLNFDVCQNCPTDTDTATTMSVSTDCVKSCVSGNEYNAVSDACEACAINFYKDNSAVDRGEYTSCVQCPDAGFRTESTGATSVGDCRVVTCVAGTYTDIDNNQCVDCGIDEFQNEDWQTSCNPCPISHGTLDGETGANDISLCYAYCPDGEEKNADNLCENCAVGYYKDNSDGRFENCTICPDPAFITEGIGSVHVDNCSIANCSEGSYRDTGDNTCKPCPYGQYQSQAWQTSCVNCPNGQTTEVTGAESQALCKTITSPVFLLNIVTTIVCSINPDLKNESSLLYQSLSARAYTIVQNIIESDLTGVFVVSVDASTAQFVGFRCFDGTLNILLQVQIETTESDVSLVETALQTVVTENMDDGSLDDPQGTAASISVDFNGVSVNDTAESADLTCADGFYTDIPSLQCVQCEQGSYQPESVPEICFPCALGVTTAGLGAIGEEEVLCVIANPGDYINHVFLLEIATNVECTELYTDSTTSAYQTLYQDATVIIRNVIIQDVDEQYRLNTPIISFVGYRCNSPIEILLEITMTNLDSTDTATVNAVITAVSADMADGVLSDPQNSTGVDDISVSILGASSRETFSSGDPECPDGQQTNLVNGQCEDCAQGTYNPQGVPELCYDCPVDTTTTGTGTVLPTGDDPTTVCTVAVTVAPIDNDFTLPDTDPDCPFFLLDDVCYTNCPSGYAPNEANVCIEADDSSESSNKKGASDVGIAVGVTLGCVFFAMLLILIACCCMRYCQVLERRRGSRHDYGEKRFLDEAPKHKSRPSSGRDYIDTRGSYETTLRPESSRHANWSSHDRSGGRAYSPYYYR